ncbi:MAG: nucleotidyltransferase family protein [Cyclobacteriaceae bacterium]
MSVISSTGLIILAAGSSSRLGRPKQLLDYKGQPLLQHTIEIAAQLGCKASALVLGANAHSIEEKIDLKSLDLITNENWEEGIASSIRFGLSHLLDKKSDLKHVLFLLSDQPYLSVEVVRELLSAHDENQAITACNYKDQMGVPVIFGKLFFEELMQLKGDQGAKKIVMKNIGIVSTITFVRGEIDVDTEEDYSRLD